MAIEEPNQDFQLLTGKCSKNYSCFSFDTLLYCRLTLYPSMSIFPLPREAIILVESRQQCLWSVVNLLTKFKVIDCPAEDGSLKKRKPWILWAKIQEHTIRRHPQGLQEKHTINCRCFNSSIVALVGQFSFNEGTILWSTTGITYLHMYSHTERELISGKETDQIAMSKSRFHSYVYFSCFCFLTGYCMYI